MMKGVQQDSSSSSPLISTRKKRVLALHSKPLLQDGRSTGEGKILDGAPSAGQVASIDESYSVLMDMSMNALLGARELSPTKMPPDTSNITLEDRLANLTALSTEELEQLAWQVEGREKMLIERLGREVAHAERHGQEQKVVRKPPRRITRKVSSSMQRQASDTQKQKGPLQAVNSFALALPRAESIESRSSLDTLPLAQTYPSKRYGALRKSSSSKKSSTPDSQNHSRQGVTSHSFSDRALRPESSVPKGFRISSTGSLTKLTSPRAPSLTERREDGHPNAAAKKSRNREECIPRANPVPDWLKKRREELMRSEGERLEQERLRIRATEMKKRLVVPTAAIQSTQKRKPRSTTTPSRGFVSSIDKRLAERAEWEQSRKRREAILDAERQAVRAKCEQEDEEAYRLERQRTVILARPVPDWIHRSRE